MLIECIIYSLLNALSVTVIIFCYLTITFLFVLRWAIAVLLFLFICLLSGGLNYYCCNQCQPRSPIGVSCRLPSAMNKQIYIAIWKSVVN